MDERHIAAAAAIIEGRSVQDAATAAHRSDPKTIYKWAEEPEFQAVVLRGIKARALLTLALYANGETNPKMGQAALAIMKWMGAAKKPGRVPSGPPGHKDEETDLPEFSREQLERLEGEER